MQRKYGRARTRSDDDDDDFWIAMAPRSCIVIEEEPGTIESPTGLLWHDGSPVMRIDPCPKQGFIGFICPSWADDMVALENEMEAEEGSEEDEDDECQS